ncbi:MAG: ABC transporter substrate-binding protein [Rhodobacteraceae bacterium]|nr:ABC transporter substrate-binding protein [Paracoccaceae bacterium]
MLMKRRTMMVGGTALALALSVAGGAMAEGEALKLGIPTSRTGPYTVLGDQVVRAVEFAVEEANAKGGVAGHPVEMKIGDTEGNPDAGRRAAEELALGGYNVLTGTISSAVGLAIASQLDRWDAMYVSVVNKSPKLTGDSCHPRMFRANHSDGMDLAIVKPWLAEQEEADWSIIAADYVWGRGSGDAFKAVATDLGKNIKVEVFPPLGTTDFAPYITQLRDSGAKGIWVALAGADAINFAKQAKQFGLTDQVKMFGHNFVVDQTLATVGADGVGVWGNVNYTAAIDTPENTAFVEAWTAKFGTPPTNYEGETYAGLQAIFGAVEKAGSVAPGDISAAFAGLTVGTVFGEVTMRAEDHQLGLPNYLGRAVAKDGGAAIEVVQSYGPDVAVPAADPACKL